MIDTGCSKAIVEGDRVTKRTNSQGVGCGQVHVGGGDGGVTLSWAVSHCCSRVRRVPLIYPVPR